MYSILYVDDDEILLRVNKIYLEKNGDYSVDIATSADEALGMIAAADYDLILSDYQMPRMDGIEFLKEVRVRHGNLPFILFTGKGREEVVMEALNNGVDFYVQKGPDLKGMLAELKHKINRAIERRKTGDELNKSRQEFRDIINFLPDATFVIDTNGRVIAWNQAMEKLTGIPNGEITGKGDYAYAVPFTGEQKPILIDTVLQDPGSPVLGNPENPRSSDQFFPLVYGGKGAHLWVRAGPLIDPDGNVTGAIETIRDITDIRKIQQDLVMSREMILGFANILPVAVYEMDLDFNLTFSNDILYALFGMTREDAPHPLCILDYLTPADRIRAYADIRTASKEYRDRGKEYLLQRADGSTFPALIYGSPVIDPDTKRPVGLRGVIIDQTRRRQDIQTLHESEERLKLALEAGDIGIWDMDMRTHSIQDVSDWINIVMGYNMDDRNISFDTCKSFVHPIDYPNVHLAFSQHIRGEAPYFETRFRLRRYDGTWRQVSVRGKVIECASNGIPVRITGTICIVSPVPGEPAFPESETEEPES